MLHLQEPISAIIVFWSKLNPSHLSTLLNYKSTANSHASVQSLTATINHRGKGKNKELNHVSNDCSSCKLSSSLSLLLDWVAVWVFFTQREHSDKRERERERERKRETDNCIERSFFFFWVFSLSSHCLLSLSLSLLRENQKK